MGQKRKHRRRYPHVSASGVWSTLREHARHNPTDLIEMVRRDPEAKVWFGVGSILALGAVATYVIASRPKGTPLLGGLFGAAGGVPGTIFTILLENKGYDLVIGSSTMPYLNQLANDYASCTNYHSAVHPSEPNYIILTSGGAQGVTDDSYHRLTTRDNLFAQMDAGGIAWGAYAESMGTPCRTSDTSLYASRHNPAVYYDSVLTGACAAHVRDFGDLYADLDADTQRYVWITPNLINDSHDGTRQQADAWLRTVVPRLMASPGYRRGGAIFILYDEQEGTADPTRIPAVVVSEQLRQKPLVDATAYDHRSYLAGVEDLMGLPRLPLVAGVTSMAGMFKP